MNALWMVIFLQLLINCGQIWINQIRSKQIAELRQQIAALQKQAGGPPQ